MLNLIDKSDQTTRKPPLSGLFRPSRAHLSYRSQQLSSHHPQITQGKQRHQLSGVFNQAAVTHLGVTELLLHNTELVFNAGTNAGFQFFKAFDGVLHWPLRDRFAFAALHCHVPCHIIATLAILSLVGTEVSRESPTAAVSSQCNRALA